MIDVLSRARDHILRTARVLERHRFEFLFGSGGAEEVVTALLPYRNLDGGFGHALEPDCRAPGSQPVTTMNALAILDEVGAVDSDLGRDLVQDICDYLVSVMADDGGVPFVYPSARDYPRAPWWRIPAAYEGSLVPTATIVGLLRRNKVDHPWVAPAHAFCWRRMEAIGRTHPYEALACLALLDHEPDRAHAEVVATHLGDLVRAGGLARLTGGEPAPTGYAEGELQYPHDYATTPDSLAHRWFSNAELDSSLDALADAQEEDGGWPVPWLHWSAVAVYEWRPWLTIEALKTLRAYGRLGVS